MALYRATTAFITRIKAYEFPPRAFYAQPVETRVEYVPDRRTSEPSLTAQQRAAIVATYPQMQFLVDDAVPRTAVNVLTPVAQNCGDPGSANTCEGPDLTRTIDVTNRAFDIPGRPLPESFSFGGSRATVILYVDLGILGMRIGVNLRAGLLFFNRNFELDIPTTGYGWPVTRVLTNAGFIASAGSLVNAAVPAAGNIWMAGLPAQLEPAV